MTQRLNDFLVKFANDLGHATFDECPFTHEVTGVNEVARISHPLGGFMSVTPRTNCGLLVLESDYAVYVHSVMFTSEFEVIVGPIVAQLIISIEDAYIAHMISKDKNFVDPIEPLEQMLMRLDLPF